jgi:hypothetical protein
VALSEDGRTPALVQRKTLKLGEFFQFTVVQPGVSSSKYIGLRGAKPGKQEGKQAFATQFSFGPRRYASRGARRLFVPQRPPMSPVFEPRTEQPRGILRVLSRYS